MTGRSEGDKHPKMTSDLVQRIVVTYDFISTPVFVVSGADNHILYVNSEAAKMVGQNKQTLEKMGFLDLFHEADRSRVSALIDLVKDESVVKEHSVRVVKRSKRVLVTDMYSRVLDWQGERVLIFTLHDITELKSAQEDLEKKVRERTAELQIAQMKMMSSSKMQALGEMAGGVAHEINNPLAIINQHAYLLKEMLASDNFDKKIVIDISHKIELTVHRISRIIKGLRAFAREGEGDPFVMNSINSIIEDTLELCREKFRFHGIDLRVSLAPNVEVQCSATQVSQVFLNLLANANDAVAEIPARDGLKKWVAIEMVEDGDDVSIAVSDCGAGIVEENREKIFEPFFTTKAVGKGTGLGLSISKGIIEGHHGSLMLDTSAPNTRFVVVLPKTQP